MDASRVVSASRRALPKGVRTSDRSRSHDGGCAERSGACRELRCAERLADVRARPGPQAVSAYSSRPISMRRISLVPAPMWLRPALARLHVRCADVSLRRIGARPGPQAVSAYSSRPISMRRISLVPAPIWLRRIGARPGPSGGLGVQFAPDQHAADLARAGADVAAAGAVAPSRPLRGCEPAPNRRPPGAVRRSRRTARARSACGGFRSCRRRFHTAWRRARGGRAGSR